MSGSISSYVDKFSAIKEDRDSLIEDKANLSPRLEQLKSEIKIHTEQWGTFSPSGGLITFKDQDEYNAFEKRKEMNSNLKQLKLQISELDSMIDQLDSAETFFREQDIIYSLYTQICDTKKLKRPEAATNQA